MIFLREILSRDSLGMKLVFSKLNGTNFMAEFRFVKIEGRQAYGFCK